jgi:hypothetical protein
MCTAGVQRAERPTSYQRTVMLGTAQASCRTEGLKNQTAKPTTVMDALDNRETVI